MSKPRNKAESSIAKRLIVSLSLGMLMVLLIASATQIYLSFSQAQFLLEKNLHQYALIAAPTFNDPLWNIDYNQTYLNVDGLLHGDNVFGAVILDEKGHEFASLGNYINKNNELVCKQDATIENFTPMHTNIKCIDDSEQLLAITEPIVREHRLLGTLTIYGNKNRIIQVVLPLIIATIVNAMIVMLALYLVSRFIIKRQIENPLRELSQHIRQLDYMNVSNTWVIANTFVERKDELGELSKAFNDMVLKISNYQNHLEDIVAERTEKLRVANTIKSDFLSHMSHEIRTPINGVLGLAELMLHEKLEPEIHNRVEMIYKSGKYLLRIVNDILDLSKIEAGKLALESIPIDVENIVNEVANVFVNHSKRNCISLNIDIDSNAPKYVYADPLRLKQILINLIANAFKFTEQGSVTLTITSQPNNILKFSVCDTGIGIAADKVERLFQAFQQADASTTRTYGGTGLGLTICKELVEMMGGHINASSNADKGSCFYFTLSLPIAEANAIITTTTFDNVNATLKKDLKILVADDQTINQIIIKAMLNKLGADPKIVHNGKAVIDLFETNATSFDLILMDCEMPIMDGWEATQTLRTMNITRDNGNPILIIGLSAHAIEGATERALAAGMNDYLTKPLAMHDLIAKLQQYDLVEL